MDIGESTIIEETTRNRSKSVHPQFYQIMRDLVLFIKNKQQISYNQLEKNLQQQILSKISKQNISDQLFIKTLKQILSDPDLHAPYKYIPIIYVSLLAVTSDKNSETLKLFYQLASHALKQLKYGEYKHSIIWPSFFEKLYQFGLLLLIGNRSILLGVSKIGLRVNSQLLIQRAKEKKVGRLVKIYNCILCIPEQYMPLKQVLSFTLIFTRWQINLDEYQNKTFFAIFATKTQRKLINKLKSYKKIQFTQQNYLSLIKVVFCGDQLMFSYFVQAKCAYESIKLGQIINCQKNAIQGLCKTTLMPQGKSLFNLIIQLLLKTQNKILPLQRQALLFVNLKFLTSKFENNEELFKILIENYMCEKSQPIISLMFRLMRDQVLLYPTVLKIKLLLNIFNVTSWNQYLRQQISEQLIIQKLTKISFVLLALSRRYNDNSVAITCCENQSGIIINYPKNIKTIISVFVFDQIGRVFENKRQQKKLLRIKFDKQLIYQIIIQFNQTNQFQTITNYAEQRQRTATIIIKQNKNVVISENKQYLRYKYGSFQSILIVSIFGKQNKKLQICLDGAYYQFIINKKIQIQKLNVGSFNGKIRYFNALKQQINALDFHKVWCQYQRKANLVIDQIGSDISVYKLNDRKNPALVDLNNSNTWSIFSKRTQITIKQAIKYPKIMQMILQLGGLHTIFFILERLSRSLLQLRQNEDKIIDLLIIFLNSLKSAAILDDSYRFVDEISLCLKYINPFLFVLIKRNKIVRQSKQGKLITSVFQLMTYYKMKVKVINNENLIKKIQKIQIYLIVKCLCNFQIWSNCNYFLQLFILKQIQSFIMNSKNTATLIKQNIHKQLLTTLLIFTISSKNSIQIKDVQIKIIQLCTLLYKNSQLFILQARQAKQVILNDVKLKSKSFVQRDINTIISYLLSFFSKIVDRSFTPVQQSALILLMEYVREVFVQNNIIFNLLRFYWTKILFCFCQISQKVEDNNNCIASSFVNVIISMSYKQVNFDKWFAIYLKSYAINQTCKISSLFYILGKISENYNFESRRKGTILKHMIISMNCKINQYVKNIVTNKMKLLEILKNIELISPKGLYRLSNCEEFKLLLQQIKQKFIKNEHQEQIKIIWKKFNQKILLSLSINDFITNLNSNFLSYIISNIFYQDEVFDSITSEKYNLVQSLSKIKQFIENKKQNKQYNKILPKQYGFSLIQHIHSIQTLYLLYDQGMFQQEDDIKLPIKLSQANFVKCPGGLLSYYLSQQCSIKQLYFLLNVLLNHHIGNNFSLLTIVAPVSIYHKTLLYLTKINKQKKISSQQSFVQQSKTIVNLLKQIIKILNSTYIIKSTTSFKQLQKILGYFQDWKKRKPGQSLDNLIKASAKIQASLEDSKIQNDVGSIMQIILNKINIIKDFQNNKQLISTLKQINEQIKRKNQIFLKKISIISTRFFEVSKQHWIIHNNSYDNRQLRYQQIAQLTNQQIINYKKYCSQLSQIYQQIIKEYNQRGLKSQEQWEKLLKSNQHWFELQGDINDLTTKFYQLDQKQIGPYGFYKLNIKPVKTGIQKLPFPRRKQYLQLLSLKEQQQKNQQQALKSRIFILSQENSYKSAFQQTNNSFQLKESLTQTILKKQKKQIGSQYWCQLITKRGVYAGKIKKQQDYLVFNFKGHNYLPQDREYRMSTSKCHRINILSQWQQKQINNLYIPLTNSSVFTRRYILRHTALQIFSLKSHKSYFINLFFNNKRNQFIEQIKKQQIDVIDNRAQQFKARGFTERWRRGQLSNFEYICLINRYSGRSTNDLAQYYVLPWVITNFDGRDGYKQIDKQFIKNATNLRDLSLPTGKLNSQKFIKLKRRFNQVDQSDKEIRFMYGTMYSNPTVLYNFFIRLQPYTSLHWEHQGRKIDHADRLFCGIAQQFHTVYTSSSDMKELTPQFYYWPQFLRNRNRIQLGKRQRGDQVDSVILPPWSKTPQQFIFKMRQVLESQQVSDKLHQWIDLIFGYKAPYSEAQLHDNLYHYQCYEHDIFTSYQNERQINTAQIAISEFGQIPQSIFSTPHPPKNTRKDINIDSIIPIAKSQKQVFQQIKINENGLMLRSKQKVVIRKTAINQIYNSFQWAKEYYNQSSICCLYDLVNLKWIGLHEGSIVLYQKGKVKDSKIIDSKYIELYENYVFFGSGSKVGIMPIVQDSFRSITSLYGHHSEVILVKMCMILDTIVSLDKSGLVLIHQLTALRVSTFSLQLLLQQFLTQVTQLINKYLNIQRICQESKKIKYPI